MKPRASTVHLIATVAWVAFMSVWANVVSHAGAFEAARAKENLDGD